MTEFAGPPSRVGAVRSALTLVVVGLFALLYAMFALGNFGLIAGGLDQPVVAVGIMTEGVLALAGAAALVKAGGLLRQAQSARAGAVALVGTAPLAVLLGLGAAFLDNAGALFYAGLVAPVAALATLVLRRRLDG